MRRVIVVAAVTALVAAAAGVGSAASFTLSTAKLGSASVATPVMFPDSIVLDDPGGKGHVVGRVDNGDTITLVYSRPIDEPTLCSTWSNTSSSQTVKVTWSVVNGTGGANDTLQVTAFPAATCANGFPIGAIDLGSGGYNTGTANMSFASNSVLTVGATTSTVVVTLAGKSGGTQGTVASGTAATWTPDGAVTDRNARNCGANLAKTSATVQF